MSTSIAPTTNTSAPGGKPATSAATAAATAAASKKTITGDFNSFLKMLTTQLKNQDPTAPMDANQFTQQLVQFSSVEQQINMNSNLEKMIALQQASTLTAAAPLMGQKVEVDSDQLVLNGHSAEVRLPKAGTASTAHVAVLDALGRTLREQDVTLGSSATAWTWDGRDSSGRQLADGAYKVAVTGADSGGAPQQVDFGVVARATGAERKGTDLALALGPISVGFDKVRAVLGD